MSNLYMQITTTDAETFVIGAVLAVGFAFWLIYEFLDEARGK